LYIANQRAGKKWSLEDDEEEEEEDGKLKSESAKVEPIEPINEEIEVQEAEDEVDPLDAFMQVLQNSCFYLIVNQNFTIFSTLLGHSK
jgi:hypothetical protein